MALGFYFLLSLVCGFFLFFVGCLITMVRNYSYRKNIKKPSQPSQPQYKLQIELQQKKKEIEEINARYNRCLGERLKEQKSLDSTYKKYLAQADVLLEKLDQIAAQQNEIQKLCKLLDTQEQTITILRETIESLEELNNILRNANQLLKDDTKSQPSDEDFRKIFNQQKAELQQSKLLIEEYKEKEKKQESSMRQKREKEKLKNTKQQQRETELNEKLITTSNRLKEKEEIQEKLKETVKNANENNCICSICYDGKIDTALTPCGHSFCQKCAAKAKQCYVCRKSCKQTLKIYIS